MKGIPLLLFASVLAGAQTPAMHKVYILPMAGGFDQYLAERIARDHVMQVVADPKSADAVLTDHLGETFETNLAKIHPLDSDPKSDDQIHPAFRSTGSKGTIFLVDTSSRQVLWSDYQKMSRATTPGVLNREAARVTKKLTEFTNPGAIRHP